jgi:hypothetical protein
MPGAGIGKPCLMKVISRNAQIEGARRTLPITWDIVNDELLYRHLFRGHR